VTEIDGKSVETEELDDSSEVTTELEDVDDENAVRAGDSDDTLEVEITGLDNTGFEVEDECT
jgi:hypothetical protein